MAQMVVKDFYGAPQTVGKLANTGSLAGAESMSVVGASTSTSTNTMAEFQQAKSSGQLPHIVA